MLVDDPSLVTRVEEILARWMTKKESRSMALWQRWQAIIAARDWEKAVAEDDSGQQLRQASPLGFVLPESVRLEIIRNVRNPC